MKLCLLSKGGEHTCKQSWKPPQLHCQFKALLPKSLCDLSKCTGGWHQPNSSMSPPRPPWFVARVCQPPASHRSSLPQDLILQKRCIFIKGAGKADGKNKRSWRGQCSSPPLPRDNLRMAGHHHTRCWLGQANFEVSQRWYSDKGRTDQHPLRLITSL